LLVANGAGRTGTTHLARPARINRAQAAEALSRTRGFTLVEAVITLLVLSMLTTFAVNSYDSYVKRARAADALEQLDQFRTHMEKAFQDNGNYGVGACAVNLPTGVINFAFSCQLGQNGQAFAASATGSGSVAGYMFSINDQGFRRTEAFPGAAVPADCWMVEKDKCR
jgi:type IV pilus assembly protein PilE